MRLRLCFVEDMMRYLAKNQTSLITPLFYVFWDL